MTITEMAEKACATATSKGFVVDPNNLDRLLLLTVGEIIEAHNELRAGRLPIEVYFSEGNKPEGFGVEVADAIIRLAQMAHALDIPLEYLIGLKMAFNDGRPPMHGGKKF